MLRIEFKSRRAILHGKKTDKDIYNSKDLRVVDELQLLHIFSYHVQILVAPTNLFFSYIHVSFSLSQFVKFEKIRLPENNYFLENSNRIFQSSLHIIVFCYIICFIF